MKYDAIARNCYHLFYDKTKIYPMAPELTKTFDVWKKKSNVCSNKTEQVHMKNKMMWNSAKLYSEKLFFDTNEVESLTRKERNFMKEKIPMAEIIL